MNNNSVITTLNDKKITRSTRHINIWYHHIQNLVEKNIIGVSYISSKQMAANRFTKALDKEKFIEFREMIGMAGSIAAEWDTGGATGGATGSSIAAEWATGGPTGWFLGFTPENYENIQKQKHSKKRRKRQESKRASSVKNTL